MSELRTVLDKIVSGQLRSMIHEHPDYLTEKGKKSLVHSATKRIVNDILSPDTIRRLSTLR